MFGFLVRGALAGAAGTTALNAATYVDMALRARPASETPQQTVAAVADKTGYDVSAATVDQTQNRLTGLGSLSGIATGVGVGVAAGILAPLLTRVPPFLATVAVGAGAMAASDVSMAKLGVTNPREWSSTDWLSDALPHLAYGAVTAIALRALAGRGSA